MNSNLYTEVEGVIQYINENIYEPLSLSRLAKISGYSPSSIVNESVF